MMRLKILLISSFVLIVGATLPFENREAEFTTELRDKNPVRPTDPPCIQMYHYIEMYADTFNIPLKYAYGIANAETSYKGPFHFSYNHALTSSAGAVGPMQVMVSTARWINKDDVSIERLKTDIKYNVYTSMKLLRKLYDKYGDWKVVFGCYNTGKPCINGYAEKVYNYNFDWKTVNI